jgi:hypothetical protein
MQFTIAVTVSTLEIGKAMLSVCYSHGLVPLSPVERHSWADFYADAQLCKYGVCDSYRKFTSRPALSD